MQSDNEFDSLLESVELGEGWRRLASQTTDKDYRRIVSFDNATSYSQLGDLHACPRRFQLSKSEAKTDAADLIGQANLDFAFGHSVGAGIQTFAATGDLTAGLFAAFVSWKADYFADLDELNAKFGKRGKKNKSLAYAQLAVEKFAAQGILNDWEIYTLPNGAPAVEVAFCVDTQNGYQHYGHIDFIMRHRSTGRIAVWEGKTDGGWGGIDEAKYANSSQGLGYGIILDHLEPELSDYEVIYPVYSTVDMEWNILPFRKSLTQKAEWLQDILLDHANITTYRKLNFFPKRGESCKQFNRRCKYFGTCDLTSHVQYVDLPAGRQAESVEFLITRDEIVASQRFKAQEL